MGKRNHQEDQKKENEDLSKRARLTEKENCGRNEIYSVRVLHGNSNLRILNNTLGN